MNSELKEITEIALGEKIASDNKQALEAYGEYKKTLSIIERVNIALGRKPKLVTTSASSIEVRISPHATNTNN